MNEYSLVLALTALLQVAAPEWRLDSSDRPIALDTAILPAVDSGQLDDRPRASFVCSSVVERPVIIELESLDFDAWLRIESPV